VRIVPESIAGARGRIGRRPGFLRRHERVNVTGVQLRIAIPFRQRGGVGGDGVQIEAGEQLLARQRRGWWRCPQERCNCGGRKKLPSAH
jgi:hypothetical protein